MLFLQDGDLDGDEFFVCWDPSLIPPNGEARHFMDREDEFGHPRPWLTEEDGMELL